MLHPVEAILLLFQVVSISMKIFQTNLQVGCIKFEGSTQYLLVENANISKNKIGFGNT